jgi:hypothetical protein
MVSLYYVRFKNILKITEQHSHVNAVIELLDINFSAFLSTARNRSKQFRFTCLFEFLNFNVKIV